MAQYLCGIGTPSAACMRLYFLWPIPATQRRYT